MIILSRYLFLILVASLPFEFRFTVLGLGNLQWVFILTLVTCGPDLLAHWKTLVRDRLIIAAGVLVLVYWISAVTTVQFSANAWNGAIRLTAGLLLLAVSTRRHDRTTVLNVWCFVAIAAAAYALADYFGVLPSDLFRSEEFFFGTAQRLSGSFEYPNTAAAFFGMSLPLIWWIPRQRWVRLGGATLVWLCLVLTFSRGAMAAVLVAMAAAWAMSTARWVRPRSLLGFGGVAFLVFGIVTLSTPLLLTRLASVGSENPFSARYELEYTGLLQRPLSADRATVTVFNNGQNSWPATGSDRVVLTHRWYDIATDELLVNATTDTRFTADIGPGEELRLEADFVTPPRPGAYLLIWDLQSGTEWFSRMRIPPVFIEVDITRTAIRTSQDRDLSHWTPPDPGASVGASVPRTTLWRAAVDMMVADPLLGVGPDNFRLLYGRTLGYDNWDTRIRSNSLYLELLATTGLLGLAAFLFVVARIRWRSGPVAIAIGIFLIHGLVDVFLMTTPIYFSFWILAGLSHEGLNPPDTARPSG